MDSINIHYVATEQQSVSTPFTFRVTFTSKHALWLLRNSLKLYRTDIQWWNVPFNRLWLVCNL